MKRALKPLALLITLLLLIAVSVSCGEKDKAPVFEELKSERIAAYYGDAGLIVPGSQFVCRAYEKADFELICEHIESEDDLLKFKAFYLLIDFNEPLLSPEGLAEARAVYEGIVTDDNPTYILDQFASEPEIQEFDNILAKVYGLTIDPASTVPIAETAAVG
ncbi:MAG: hypothetical protein ACOX4O_07950 [Eubacteriales bacterium]|jgi:hypothetical protein